jgi:hypothetical protein
MTLTQAQAQLGKVANMIPTIADHLDVGSDETRQTSDATLYTPEYLKWYAKHNTPKGKRLVKWMIRVGEHVELLIDYKDKAGWIEQKSIVLSRRLT